LARNLAPALSVGVWSRPTIAFSRERAPPERCHGCRTENLVNTDVLAHPRVGFAEIPQHVSAEVWVYRAQPLGPVNR
jgi:hypothetical protein